VKRSILVDGPDGVEVVRLAAGCTEVPRHLTPGAAQVVVPPADWKDPYRIVQVFCGPEGTRPAGGGRYTAGTRWFG
jgi:hypothetical protein